MCIRDRTTSHGRGTVALEYLAEAVESGEEQALFWAAQAHILRAELRQAAALFGRLKTARHPGLRNRSLLSLAHILVALGEPTEAGTLLQNTFPSTDKTHLSQEARLLHATILIAQDKLMEAGKLLAGGAEPSDRRQQTHTLYLRAQLIARKEKNKAIPLFQAIAEDTKPVPPLLRHLSLIHI